MNRSSCIILLIALLASLLLAEVTIRHFGQTKPSGEFAIGKLILKPYKVPVKSIADQIEKYRSKQQPRIIYDRTLGWTVNSLYKDPEGIYSYNNIGSRNQGVFSEIPPQDTLRILTFGDSYTHGDEVPNSDTWQANLANMFNKTGEKVEVLNFGVSAYAMDQALLRWKKDGKQLNPSIVIFGLQPENIKRNLNLVRFFYTHNPNSIFFTKPRFILEHGKLKLVNSPTPEILKRQDFYGNIFSWPTIQYEYFFKPDDYHNNLLFKSKLVSLIETIVTTSNKYAYRAKERSLYDINNNPAKLALAIIDSFSKSVERSGAEFIIVHLPRRRHLDEKVKFDRSLVYNKFLTYLKEKYLVIDPSPELVKQSDQNYIGYGHYSKMGNSLIANKLYSHLIEQPMLLSIE